MSSPVASDPIVIEYIVDQLVKHRHRNDIIMTLCEKTGISWNEAQLLVERVEQEQHRKIATGQSPLLIVIGLAVIIGGIYIVLRYTLATLDGAVMFLWPFPIPYLGNAARIGAGLAMIAGGSYGIFRVLWSIFK